MKRGVRRDWTRLLCASALLAATANGQEIRVADSASEAIEALARGAQAESLFAVDLTATDKGQLLDLRTPRPLPAGRYRLHLPLALTPATHPACRDLTITVKTGSREQTLLGSDLADTFSTLPVSFTTRGGLAEPIQVSWEAGEEGKRYRLRETARKAPKQPDALDAGGEEEDDWDDMLGSLDERADGSIPLASLAGLPVRLAARYPVIETLSPLAVTELRPNKVLYLPGEKGSLAITVKHFAAGTGRGDLSVVLRTGLGTSRELARQTVEAGPDGKRLEIPFTAHDRWGAEIAASLTVDGRTETWRDYFGAADNFWEMGIGHAYPIFTQGDRGRKMITGTPGLLRSKYSNWLDLFFWAPCDWSKLTPPGELWWGGQTSYPQSDTNLKAFIKALQKEGIRVATYAKGNAAGPFGWETARQHPEWFGGGRFSGRYDVEILDHYNDPDWRARREAEEKELDVGWYTLGVDLTQLDAVDYGVTELIASVDYYGWDAVRFDGHYSTGFDELSTRNMRRLKERVLEAHPTFRLGYNWGRAPEWRGGYTHELREAMAGGGMFMQEGIRAWSYTGARYWSWDHYAENELRIAKRIYAMGGSYHCILDLQGELSADQRYYKLVHSLIAGAHPAYGTHSAVSGSPSWGAFMTRWAEVLWHPHLRLVEDPEQLVTVDAENVKWKPFVQECVLTPERRRIVVHLLNPPTDDNIGRGRRPALGATPVPVTFTLPDGETLDTVWLIRPDREPFGQALGPEATRGRKSVTVPPPRHWSMVVAETRGEFSVPPMPPAFTEPPDLTHVPQGSGKGVLDPNRRDDLLSLLPSEGFERLLNHGSANIGPPLISDPDSELGTVQGRAKDKKTAHMGLWWIGHPTGRFDAYLRVKWTDEKEKHTPQRLDTKISLTYNPHKWQTATLVTPDYPDPPEGAVVMKASGAYHDYKIATLDAWWGGCFCFVTDAITQETGDNELFQERIIFKLVEPFTDRMLVEHGHKLPEKPAGLRQPSTGDPKKILVKAGMFWQVYLDNAPFEYDLEYKLPDTYEALYAYDAVILVNTDLGGIDQRNMIREYVLDGGRLILFGGNHALKYTSYADTAVTELLPFVLQKEDAVSRLMTPALLGSRKATSDPDKPALFWRHEVQPHAGAETLAWADDRPVTLRLQTGKGSVTAFIGTPLGSPEQGETPFWKTGFWGRHLESLVTE